MKAALHGSGANAIRLQIDIDGAEYIAEVMENEWLQRNDQGAREIAEALRCVIPEARLDEEFFA